jgi:hypothetical protein
VILNRKRDRDLKSPGRASCRVGSSPSGCGLVGCYRRRKTLGEMGSPTSAVSTATRITTAAAPTPIAAAIAAAPVTPSIGAARIGP